MQRRRALKCNPTGVGRYKPYTKDAAGAGPPPPTNKNDIETAWHFIHFLQNFKIENPRKPISQVMEKGIKEWVGLDTDLRKFYIDTIKNNQTRKLYKKREERTKRKSGAGGKPTKLKALRKKKCMAACCNPKKAQPKAELMCHKNAPYKLKDA